MPLHEISETSSFKDNGGSLEGKLLRHSSAPLFSEKAKKVGGDLDKSSKQPQVDQRSLTREGSNLFTTIDGHPAPLPPPASLPPASLTESQFIGTVEVKESVAAAQERKLRGLSVSDKSPSPALDDTLSKSRHYDWEIDPKKLILKNLIARGTFGTVHRGLYDGQDVAVKLLDWGEDEAANRADLFELRNAFIQEVSVWSTLNHPNVTQFIGAILGGSEGFKIPSHVTSDDGHMLVEGHVSCVVLEYLPGGTLKKLLHQHKTKKLPLKLVVQFALDIARGLAYLHSKHIVHRDVKSENMLLDKHKEVKIADFGVSRVEEESCKELHQLAGTYGYMAPEVLLGVPYDHKVDVYSFGILLWEIYACDNPFPFLNFNPADIKSFVTQGLRPDIPSCCPPDLASLMRRTWDKDPDKRPDMAEVVHLLEKVDTRHGKPMAHDEFGAALHHQHGHRGGPWQNALHKLKNKLSGGES